ncbi:MAG: putative ATPase, partial [Bacteroidia bacterium]
MQKIVIKNFGAIKEAEIKINKVLVLIGEQASGKSTIAKLIYFFKSLKRDFFDSAYNLEETHNSGPRGFS